MSREEVGGALGAVLREIKWGGGGIYSFVVAPKAPESQALSRLLLTSSPEFGERETAHLDDRQCQRDSFSVVSSPPSLWPLQEGGLLKPGSASLPLLCWRPWALSGRRSTSEPRPLPNSASNVRKLADHQHPPCLCQEFTHARLHSPVQSSDGIGIVDKAGAVSILFVPLKALED